MPSEWQSVATLPQLESDELQLWRINLSDAVGDHYTYRQHLSSTELERAERLRAGQVRMQFVTARASLRVLLGNLLNLPPNLVPITLSAYGKPETPPANKLPLFFNIAHSRETILIALCRSSSVGVDLEYLDRETDILGIARDSFTAAEFRQIAATTDLTARRMAFFQCWTRKEAVIKADGRGLSLPLNSVEVPVGAPVTSTPILIGDPETPKTWFVTDIPLGAEIAGAFAVALPGLVPRTLSFPFGMLSGG
jgi:4'-phosphopantetheinyl transferase